MRVGFPLKTHKSFKVEEILLYKRTISLFFVVLSGLVSKMWFFIEMLTASIIKKNRNMLVRFDKILSLAMN